MARRYKAIINPELLVWARSSAGMDPEEAVRRLRKKRIKLDVSRLKSWETGAQAPTVAQLLKIAKVYRQSFAAFYLASPPAVFTPPTRDYRRPFGKEPRVISPELAFEMRLSMERREICLELLSRDGESPPFFDLTASVTEDPEQLGSRLRSFLGIEWERQQRWRDSRIALNAWRDQLEAKGVLVFQGTEVEPSDMRGFSIAQFPLPIIVVNRKDAYAGRVFSMIHELAHIVLQKSGLCDLDETSRIEVFCNRVAGSALVPRKLLLNEPLVKRTAGPYWDDGVLESLARMYSVSREVILRRLLTFGLTDSNFYETKREQYLREYGKRRESTSRGFLDPVTDVKSAAGKRFIGLVLDALESGHIMAGDACEFLGVRSRHFDRLALEISLG